MSNESLHQMAATHFPEEYALWRMSPGSSKLSALFFSWIHDADMPENDHRDALSILEVARDTIDALSHYQLSVLLLTALEHTLDEIARRLNVTPERIRHIQAQVARKIKKVNMSSLDRD